MAGCVVDDDDLIFINKQFYLYTNQGYWTGSPFIYANKNGYSRGIAMGNSILGSNTIDDKLGVRPVINISSSAKLSGDGTYNNVYTVK